MLTAIANAFRVPELRRKILFTLAMIALYRLGCFITVPGIDAAKVLQLIQSNNALGLLGLFSGGALEKLAVFSLGIMPYITSSIIMQLLQGVIPTVEKWAKEGESGQRKITQITRYMTLGIALLESIGLLATFRSAMSSTFSAAQLLETEAVIVITLIAGTAFIMWMGELITQHGVGNGMSLLIFANIVARFPDAIRQSIQFGRVYGGSGTYIPLKINGANVVPIIFASAILFFPSQIALMWPSQQWLQLGAASISKGPVNWVLDFVLIVFFTYFYTALVFNPIDLSDNLRKNGGFIPGVRPGSATTRYIENVLNRITLPGALFLGVIAVVPAILFYQTNNQLIQSFGGTSILIMVGVALETMTQLESQLKMRHYEGFFK